MRLSAIPASSGQRSYAACVLGSFRVVERGTGAELPLRSRKALATIACAALAPTRSVTRDRLTGLLWGSRGEEQARGSLRQVVAELRASPLGEAGVLAISRQAIGIVPDRMGSDLGEIATAAAACDYPALTGMLDHLDGHILDGLDGIDNGFDDWLRIERERLLDRLLESVLRACGGDRSAATLIDRRSILSALQRIAPVHEQVARLALQLDHEAGDHAALHRRFRTLERTLAREYGASPSPETQTLFRQLTAVVPIRTPPPEAEQAAPQPESAPAAGGLEPPIVVIVPLEVRSGNPDQVEAANVCVAELEIALGGIADIRLLSLPEPKPEALQAVAAGQSVASYLLRGWLHAADGGLRIKWLLTRIRDGLLVWSRKFEIDRAGLGSALDEVVARVAGAVLPAVERDMERAPPTARTIEASGYELYYRGRTLMLAGGTLAEKRKAADLFEQAIAREPLLVDAHLSLARLYNTDFEQRMAGHDPAPLRERAFELCARAVSVDPGSARAQARMGWCYLRRGDVAQAIQRFEEALALCPYHADCVNEIGFGFVHLGQLERGATLLSRAFELNPFPRNDYFADMAVLMMLSGEQGRAEEHFEIACVSALHYRAARLANLALLRGGGHQTASLADAVRADILAIWQPQRPSCDADLLSAILQFLPLHRSQDRAMLSRGLAAAGWDLEGEVSARRVFARAGV